jgi:hypothetical protein
MPHYLPASNTCDLCIPRTGTHWRKRALENAGVTVTLFPKERREKDYHYHSYEPFPNCDFVYTFIRHPAPYLKSRYFLPRGSYPGPNLSDLRERSKNCFYRYIDLYLKEMPGAISGYFLEYTKHCDFVGRIENSSDDLIKAMQLAGEKFDEQVIRDTAPVNTLEQRSYHKEKWGEAEFLDGQVEAIVDAEQVAMSLWLPTIKK